MKYINKYCADVGTSNCPCPLAETGDCLICGRLSGKGVCDCHWAGLCIYNEYIQNDSVVRNPRQDQQVRILQKTWYGDDLLMMELETSRDMALKAANPGAFVFLRTKESALYTSVPVSVMMADMEKGRLWVMLKIISSKTKRIADEDGSLLMRGIYRNGLLGGGLEGLDGDLKGSAENMKGTKRQQDRGDAGPRKKWLIMTRGAGLAPAVNLLRWAGARVESCLMIDTEKIGEELVRDTLHKDLPACPEGAENQMETHMVPLQELLQNTLGQKSLCLQSALLPDVQNYDRVFILASDYYIKAMSETFAIPDDKLIFSNNFHMCCGEGICGACGHTDAQGTLHKMCKCRYFDAKALRG